MECMRQLMHWFVVYPRSWKAYHLNVSRGEWSPCECKILVLTRISSKVKSTDCRCIFSSMHGPSYSCFILHIILYLVLVLSYKFSVFPPWSNFGRREQSERPQLTVSVSVCTLGVLWMVVDWGCVWHTYVASIPEHPKRRQEHFMVSQTNPEYRMDYAHASLCI